MSLTLPRHDRFQVSIVVTAQTILSVSFEDNNILEVVEKAYDFRTHGHKRTLPSWLYKRGQLCPLLLLSVFNDFCRKTHAHDGTSSVFVCSDWKIKS